ncbi:Retrovirus-related Pol polyprotein from type-2 retrotransposable element R2DM; Endonuclease [Eumeta japonica]|uniref:Retrovirus-related Pol polyprotein from type-2 retrotransposable element R2DM Endonuclease n=1 Tax=Eumeta variegata TaxID=151549 RepID=A0A4C1XD52_EUMVA|nr:Retrovirus-related Pol polyprotein from type-2 retrotransposable element R2DM; Endonuclease [Eumeta japonica]
MTYEFLRTFKKQTGRKQPKRFIPISTWIYELHKVKGPDFRISQSDIKTIISLSTDTIHNIIKQMKKATVPGPDQMVIELYQHAPEVFVKQVTKIIGKACENNPFPQEWVETIQIPIPKKTRPQSVNDYRKISICNAGYRIYATYLLKLLDEEIETMGNYQAAFMRYRSTDDHIFVVRRILDEKWKAGKPAYVLQLDIEKAFDSVDFCALYDILRTRVNTTLANRIMSCLKEHTSILWFGQNPKYHQRKRGQTRMSTLTSAFTIVLDDVLRTLEELVSEVRLDQDAEINLPVILSFADDIIIIGDSTTVLTNIMKNLKELLISVGLKLNETKTKMLVRDPINKSIAKQTQEINGVLITPWTPLNIWAIRNAKGLIPFIKKTKMHWKIAKLIYKMVISPSMTYGLNVVALTKSNRTRLRQYEREILKDMLQAARNQPKLKTQEILEGKTITKIIKIYYNREKSWTSYLYMGRSLRQDLNYHNRNQEEWDTLAQNKMEMKKLRMNYTNSQKRTPKALHRVKKMKNRRLTGKTNLLQISYTYKRYYNGNQEEQSKLKIRKVVDELYQLSLAPKVYLSKENEV